MSEINKDNFDIEGALSRMEEINGLLSQQNTSLRDSLELYKEGVALAEECKKRLEGVEKELQVINPMNPGNQQG